jgi:catechol 2,3-dioxygenase-like lactoylglutathione lyase family enzyme
MKGNGRVWEPVSVARKWKGNTMSIIGIDHIQLAIPKGGEAQAVAFYETVLGLSEVPKPESLSGRGGAWLSNGHVCVHLGVDPDFVAARKAHPAFLVTDLGELEQKLDTLGIETRKDVPLEGYKRLHIADPFGNRIELMQKL